MATASRIPANQKNIYTSSPLGLLVYSLPNYFDVNGQWDGRTQFSSYTSKDGNSSGLQVLNLRGDLTNVKNPILSKSPHSDQIYDISTRNIVESLDKISHMRLTYSDFAYLKDFGVYPNNRLFIARRYPRPVVDDLYSVPTTDEKFKNLNPQSTIIGYLPGEEENFIKLKFNEEWENSEVSFTNLLNDLGKDFGFQLGGGLGSILEGGVNILPLPGATLLLQRKIMASLGLFGDGVIFDSNPSSSSYGKFIQPPDKTKGEKFWKEAEVSSIPQGDPNLVKEAMNRRLVGENEPGAGIKCKVQITLKTKYEQKFIDGVDPTYVFMDILNNCLQMGTSPANFYLGKQVDAAGNIQSYLDRFMKDPFTEIQKFIGSIIDAFSGQLKFLSQSLKEVKDSQSGKKNDEKDTNDGKTIEDLIKGSISSVPQYVKDFIKEKYKVKFLGIINALTGGPSTPWHITIGNPLRPIFCSGDMICQSVSVNFGPQLSFNDLPTYIEVEIELESARNLGLQEIFAKFNTGGIRVVEGPNRGKYLSPESTNYWNSNGNYNGSTPSNVTSQEAGQTDQTPDATNRLGTQLNELQTKVVIPSISLSNLSITPTDTNLQVNTDPFSDSPVISSGTDANSQNLRTDLTQEITGETDGFTDQQNSIDIPNTGEDSSIIDNANQNKNLIVVNEQVVTTSTKRLFNGQTETLYQVFGTYQINGKTYNTIGESFSTSETTGFEQAKIDARNKAQKNAK